MSEEMKTLETLDQEDIEAEFVTYVESVVRNIANGGHRFPRENREVLTHYHWIDAKEDDDDSEACYFLSLKVRHVKPKRGHIALILFSAQELQQLYEVVENLTGLTLSSIQVAEHERNKFDSSIEWLFTPQGRIYITSKEYID